MSTFTWHFGIKKSSPLHRREQDKKKEEKENACKFQNKSIYYGIIWIC